MYRVGDKVVYPMHGAGVVLAVEEREVLGERSTYYVVHMPFGELDIMVPVGAADAIGLRPVLRPAELRALIQKAAEEQVDISCPWNRRFRDNMEKMKRGDIASVAEVWANLWRRERAKGGLSAGERKMMEMARRILLSEICLAGDIDAAAAEEFLVAALA